MTMKKIIFMSLMVVLSSLGCSAQPKASARIHLSECGGDTMFLKVTDDNMMAIERTDTIVLPVSGEYLYQMPTTRIKFVSLQDKHGNFGFVMRPGETALVEGKDLGDVQISGSPYYESQEMVAQQEKPINQEMAAFQKDLMDRANSGKHDMDSLKVEMKEKSSEFEKRLGVIYQNFVRQHPDDDYSVFLLTRLVLEYDTYKPLVSSRALNGMMSPLVKTLDDMSVRIKQRMQASEQLGAGKAAPVIVCKDINGKDFDLAKIKGKVVVLDFWGSWCGWCIKGMPKMKEYYQKYKGKLEIVGVDCNDTDAKWKAAVAKHQLPWLHVRSIPKENDIALKYAVSAFPTKVLIGKDGRIVKTFVGEAEDFYQKLDELLAK